MKQERLKVLTLLEEGKISADEANKLLDTLRQDDRHFISDDTAEQVEEKLQRFAKNVDGFAREFGHKVEKAYRDLEPRLKKASQIVLEKTTSVVDEVSKSLHESIDNARAKAEEEAAKADSDDDDTPMPN